MKDNIEAWAKFVENETIYDNAIRLQYLHWIIQKFIQPNTKILEVGFGSGNTAFLLASMGYNVTGIDINEILVERMKKKYSNIFNNDKLSFKQSDMLSLPWEENSFELAYHQGVLEHFSNEIIIKALKEQARVANWVIFDVPNNKYKNRPFGDERLLPISEWKQMIKDAELDLVYMAGRNFKPWHYFLSMAFFSKTALFKIPWALSWLGSVSIFVCRSKK